MPKDSSDKTVIVTDKVVVQAQKPTLEPYLIQISGRETGNMLCLTGKTIRIGRDPQCEIAVDDPHVSRVHAELDAQGQQIVLRDLGSTNGVFVNGMKITEQVLSDGDKVLVGTKLYFKLAYQDTVEQSYQQNLFRAANIDALTQLYNKKYFIDALSKEFSFSRRNQQPLSLLLMDIDHFKNVNDTHGHVAGDFVLKALGMYLHKNLRLENIAARYGGEEFAIILRHVSSAQAYFIAERLRMGIAAEKIDFRGKPLQVTLSIGIATFLHNNFETIEDLIQKADEFLYQAKTSGRNRTAPAAPSE